MVSRSKTTTELQFHLKVIHNLGKIRCSELAKVIKKHTKIADRLRRRMITKGWCTSGS